MQGYVEYGNGGLEPELAEVGCNRGGILKHHSIVYLLWVLRNSFFVATASFTISFVM